MSILLTAAHLAALPFSVAHITVTDHVPRFRGTTGYCCGEVTLCAPAGVSLLLTWVAERTPALCPGAGRVNVYLFPAYNLAGVKFAGSATTGYDACRLIAERTAWQKHVLAALPKGF